MRSLTPAFETVEQYMRTFDFDTPIRRATRLAKDLLALSYLTLEVGALPPLDIARPWLDPGGGVTLLLEGDVFCVACITAPGEARLVVNEDLLARVERSAAGGAWVAACIETAATSLRPTFVTLPLSSPSWVTTGVSLATAHGEPL
jgi:hypothetical protein